MRAIQSAVESGFINPAKGLKCTIHVRTKSNGEVVEATVIKSSGDANFDRQAEIAVRKAAPLPLPTDANLYEKFREFNFVFEPE
jgi:colicin import membrane protein